MESSPEVLILLEHQAESTDGGENEAVLPTFLGNARVSMNDPSNIGIYWVNIIASNEVDIIGEVLVGMYPFHSTVPKLLLQEKAEKGDDESSWFWQRKKKKSIKQHKMQKSFVETFVDKYIRQTNADGTPAVVGESESVRVTAKGVRMMRSWSSTINSQLMGDLLELLDLLKQDEGRMMIYHELFPSDGQPVRLSIDSFGVLTDVLNAALRESNGKKDYRACKCFMDAAQLYYTDVTEYAPGMQNAVGWVYHSFAYSMIREHEAFQNSRFWEDTFTDAISHMQQYSDSSKLSAIMWNNLTDEEKESVKESSSSQARTLLRFFGLQMLNANIEKDVIERFLTRTGRLYGVRSAERDAIKKSMDLVLTIREDPWTEVSEESEQRGGTSSLLAPAHRRVSRDDSIVHRTMKSKLFVLDDIRARAGSMQRKQSNAIERPREETRGNWTKLISIEGTAVYVNSQTQVILREPPAEWEAEGHKSKQRQLSGIMITDKPNLVLGELQVLYIHDVELISYSKRLRGSLFMSNYRLIFLANDTTFNKNPDNYVYSRVGLHSLHKLDLNNGILSFFSKDIRVLRFDMQSHHDQSSMAKKARKEALDTLMHDIPKYAFPSSLTQSFAYFYRDPVSPSDNGWHLYDPVSGE